MKGATIGGAVPAILFNTPGTPDAFMTTLDGHPMAKSSQAGRALRIAHFSSASGDTFSDIVLTLCAPFMAILVERYLDLPEKMALLILSLAFIAAVIGKSIGKELISLGLDLLAVSIGTRNDLYPRLSNGYGRGVQRLFGDLGGSWCPRHWRSFQRDRRSQTRSACVPQTEPHRRA